MALNQPPDHGHTHTDTHTTAALSAASSEVTKKSVLSPSGEEGHDQQSVGQLFLTPVIQIYAANPLHGDEYNQNQ